MCDKDSLSENEEFVLRKKSAQPSVAFTTSAYLLETLPPLGEQLCLTAGATSDGKLLKGSLQARAIYFCLFKKKKGSIDKHKSTGN